MTLYITHPDKLKSPTTLTLESITIRTPKFPDDLQISKEIGKGSNNQVLGAKLRDMPCVLRVPRRKSDTQQRGSALWELKQTLHAANVKAAPRVLDAWYVRHARGRWTSGLYMIMERLDCTLDDALCDSHTQFHKEMFDDPERARTCVENIGRSIEHSLERLSESNLFVFDLKPSNLLLRYGEEKDSVTAHIIDFGRDFCEWEHPMRPPDTRTPIVDGLRKLVQNRTEHEPGEDKEALIHHILFASMLVQLSAVTTQNILSDRRSTRFTAEERELYHPFTTPTRTLLKSMRGENVSLLKWVLRDDQVRGCLSHYLGRRNSGTRRVIAMAQGIERP